MRGWLRVLGGRLEPVRLHLLQVARRAGVRAPRMCTQCAESARWSRNFLPLGARPFTPVVVGRP